MPGMLTSSLVDAFLVSAVGLSAWGYGWWMVPRDAQSAIPGAAFLTRLAGGLAVLSVLLFGLGQLNLAVKLFMVAALFPGWLAAGGAALPRRQDPNIAGSRPGLGGTGWWLLAMAGPPLLTALAGTRVPEWFYDALYYQTAFPSLYLLRGSIEIFHHAVHSAMPASINVLFMPLLAFGSATTVKLAHFSFWLGCAAWVFLITRRYSNPAAGAAAATLFLALPGPAFVAGLGAVDHGATFFLLGALFLLAPAGTKAEGGSRALVAGLLLGTAVASKYTVLPAGSLLALIALWSWRRLPRPLAIRRLGWFAGGVIATALPWYARNFVVLGNPVYPVMAGPGSPGAVAVSNLRLDSGPPYAFHNLFSLPLDIVFERRGFGAGSELWPVGLILLPALAWALWRGGFWRWTASAALVLLALWSQGPLILRYLYPVLALTSAMAGGMLFGETKRRLTRFLAAVLVSTLTVFGTGRVLILQKTIIGGVGDFLLGRTNCSEFLDERVQHAPAARWVRKHTDLHETKLLFIGETAGYYFRRDYEPVSAYDRHPMAEVLIRHNSPAGVANELSAAGFTHVIWNPGELDRLNQRYEHLPLVGDEARLLWEFLSQCEKAFAANGVSVLTIPR